MRLLKRLLKVALYGAGAFVALMTTIALLMAAGVVKPATPKPPFPSVVVDTPPTRVAAPARPRVPVPPPASAAPTERHWYEGGTLSGAGAIDWQKATHENKLASCADILAKLWMDGHLAPNLAERLRTVDDLKEPARQLTQALDGAFVGDPDPKQNARMLTNQTVRETAVLLLAMMHWLKT